MLQKRGDLSAPSAAPREGFSFSDLRLRRAARATRVKRRRWRSPCRALACSCRSLAVPCSGYSRRRWRRFASAQAAMSMARQVSGEPRRTRKGLGNSPSAIQRRIEWAEKPVISQTSGRRSRRRSAKRSVKGVLRFQVPEQQNRPRHRLVPRSFATFVLGEAGTASEAESGKPGQEPKSKQRLGCRSRAPRKGRRQLQ